MSVLNGRQPPRSRCPFFMLYLRLGTGLHNWVVVENVNDLDTDVRERVLREARSSFRDRLGVTHNLIRNFRLVAQDARRGGDAPAAEVHLEVRGMGDSVGILPINAVRSPTTAGIIRTFVITHANFDRNQVLSILHPWYEPAQYPILRPLGEDGWTPSMLSTRSGRHVTLARFCTQEILRSPYLTAAGRLFGEWACDNACRLHDERLSFIQYNQRRLVPFSEMRASAGARGGGRQRRGRGQMRGRGRGRGRRPVQTRVVEPRPGALPGRIILPGSFTTSPRWYRNYLEDALAVGARLGSPTFFITLTANTRWPEITNELLPGQSACDRPDITLRVFRARMLALRPHLEEIFCPDGVRYSLQVYEFQHRGDPAGCAQITFFCQRNKMVEVLRVVLPQHVALRMFEESRLKTSIWSSWVCQRQMPVLH